MGAMVDGGKKQEDRQGWIQEECPGKMRLKETDKERDHHRDGEAREMVEIMTRGTEDQITESNDQVATENFIQQVETGENPERTNSHGGGSGGSSRMQGGGGR